MSLDLLYLVRDHDLPPKWDGHTVTWSGWETITEFVCPPPRPECCRVCGSLAPLVVNRGRYYRVSPRTGRTQSPSLVAYRCPDCKTDRVYESARDVWWDLDPSDYADDGSRAVR